MVASGQARSAAPGAPARPPLAIDEIKARIHAMLAERAGLAGSSRGPVLPGQYWSDFCSNFSYVVDLSERSLERLRLHTYHLTGDNYQTYYFTANPARWRQLLGVDALVRDLPERYVIDEPEGGIGLRFPDGRFLSSDTVRFQRVIRTLARRGILQGLEGSGELSHVLEIGGGYGGLAYHLLPLLGRSRYFILDLPETLFFSAVYLTRHAAEKRLYLYDAADYESVLATGFEGYDYVLVPNWRLPDLERFRFDLAINVESLQEMTTADATAYLDFLRRRAKLFYSFNMDRNHKNTELSSLNALIRSRFDVEAMPAPPVSRKARLHSALRALAKTAGLMDASALDLDVNYHEFVCRPKGGAATAAHV